MVSGVVRKLGECGILEVKGKMVLVRRELVGVLGFDRLCNMMIEN